MNKSNSLEKIFEFAKLLNKFRLIERVLYVTGTERKENDIEHSYQLALMGWYINSFAKLGLDSDKIIQYALLHDLVEVYAGDTYIFDKDPKRLESKEEREHAAFIKLREEFPQIKNFWDLVEEYEKKEDEESCFIYALDKIYPIINIYLNGGREWQEQKVSLEMLYEHKKDKVALSPCIEKYFLELIALLEKERDALWPKMN